MALSFADLKKNRGASSLSALSDELKKISGEKEVDERFWYPAVDKVGNGYAVIRFLPAPAGENAPFVKVFSHSFQGPNGSWYIENSLNTIGQEDPVGLENRVLWNSGREEDKETARKQKRKLTYYSNILIVKDPANPENEGTVKLYKYGQKIFDKIKAKAYPENDFDEKMNPFDPWEGMNLKLKIRQKDGYRNYDDSEWDSPKPISADDEIIEKIYDQCHSLNQFIDAKNFKKFEELKERFLKVTAGVTSVKESVAPTAAAKETKSAAKKPAPEKEFATDDEDEDDFLAKLAED